MAVIKLAAGESSARGMNTGQAVWLPVIAFAALARVWILYAGRAVEPVDAVKFFTIPVAAAVWFFIERRKLSPKGSEPACLPAFWLSAACLALYAVSIPLFPNLAQAMIGMAALGFAFAAAYPADEGKKRFAYGIILPLALPLEPTLQFVIGYPLRKLTGLAASAMLAPYGVRLHGTILQSPSCVVDVDAPCSGVRGLTAFLLAGAVAALARKEGLAGTAFLLAGALVSALFYNIVRSSWLFMAQYHLGSVSPGLHSAIGGAAFAAGLGTLFGFATLSNRLFRKERAA